MHRVKVFLVFALVLAIGACAAIGLQTDAQKIAAACAGASASVKVLTAANALGKLSVEQQSGIVAAIDIATPVCAADTPPDLDDVQQQAFVAAITALQIAAASVTAPQEAP